MASCGDITHSFLTLMDSHRNFFLQQGENTLPKTQRRSLKNDSCRKKAQKQPALVPNKLPGAEKVRVMHWSHTSPSGEIGRRLVEREYQSIKSQQRKSRGRGGGMKRELQQSFAARIAAEEVVCSGTGAAGDACHRLARGSAVVILCSTEIFPAKRKIQQLVSKASPHMCVQEKQKRSGLQARSGPIADS